MERSCRSRKRRRSIKKGKGKRRDGGRGAVGVEIEDGAEWKEKERRGEGGEEDEMKKWE
jgi:hypothetical protein